jgi:hypothetical protein
LFDDLIDWATRKQATTRRNDVGWIHTNPQ